MSLSIKTSIHSKKCADSPASKPTSCGAKRNLIVSNNDMDAVAEKFFEILALQGIACVQCPKFKYMLYPLSGDGLGVIEGVQQFRMEILCEHRVAYTFEISTKITDMNMDKGGLQ